MGGTIVCMVTVTDIDTRGTKSAPTGGVLIAITEGATTTNTLCSPLVAAGGDSATCAFDVTRAAAATLTVRATYDNPDVHSRSESGSVTLQWMGVSEPGGEGCSPGFWKNHPEAWTGANLSVIKLGELFEFPNALKSFLNVTLQASLDFRGGNGNAGAAEILLRAGTAAWLNALHADVAYPLEAAEVLSRVQAALDGGRVAMLTLSTELDEYNNLGCFVTTTR